MKTSVQSSKKYIVYIQGSDQGETPKATAGYPIKTVKVSRALTYLKNHESDVSLALVDHRMELPNGRRLLTDLKRSMPEMPVVIFTPEPLKGFAAIEMNANGYLNSKASQKAIGNYIQNFLRARGV